MNIEKHLYTIREMNIEEYLYAIDPSFSSDAIIDPFDYVSSPPPTVVNTTDRANMETSPTNPILFRIDQNAENTNTEDQGIQLQQQLKQENSELEMKKKQISLVGEALDVAKNLENELEMEASTQTLKDRITKLEQCLELEKKNRYLAEQALDIVTKNLEQESEMEANTLSLKDEIITLQQKLVMEKKNRSLAEQSLGMVTKNLENELELETIGLLSHDNQISAATGHNMEDPEMEMVTVTGDVIKSELQNIIQEENSKMFARITRMLSESNEAQRNFECRLRDELSSIKSEMQDTRNVCSFHLNQLKANNTNDGADGHTSNEVDNESSMTTQHILDVNTPPLATPENKVARYPVHCPNLTPLPERSLVEAPPLNFPIHTGNGCNNIATQDRLADTCTRLSTILPRQAEVQNPSPTRNPEARDTPVPWFRSNISDSTSYGRVPMSIDMTGRLTPAVRYFTFNNDSGGDDGLLQQQSDSQAQFVKSTSAESAAEIVEDCATPRKSKEAITFDKDSPPVSITSSSVPAQVFRPSRYYTKYLVSSCPKMMRGKYKWSMLFSSCTKRRSSPTVRSPPSTSNSLRRLATINSKTAFGIVATESVSDFSDFRCPVVFLYEDGDVYADGDFHTSKLFFQDGDQVTFTLDLLMMEGATGGTLSAAVNDGDNVLLASNLNTLLEPNEGFFPVVWLNRHKNAKFFGFEEILTEI